MLTTNIIINATNEEEILYALEEVKRKLEAGNLFGNDQREDGITDYNFKTDGEESEYIVCPKCSSYNYYEDKKPTTCFDCGHSLEDNEDE